MPLEGDPVMSEPTTVTIDAGNTSTDGATIVLPGQDGHQDTGQQQDSTQQPAAKPTLEDSLAVLDESTRKFVLDQVRSGRQENQNLRAKIRDLQPKADEHEKARKAQQSAEQRAQEAQAEAEKRASDATRRMVRSEIRALAASDFADPDDAAVFLADHFDKYAGKDGEPDTDAIKTDLKDLLSRRPHLAKPADNSPRRPAPDRSQGSSGTNGKPTDMNALIRQQIAARRRG